MRSLEVCQGEKKAGAGERVLAVRSGVYLLVTYCSGLAASNLTSTEYGIASWDASSAEWPLWSSVWPCYVDMR